MIIHRLKYIFVLLAPLILVMIFNACVVFVSPGVADVKAVATVSDLEGLVRSQTSGNPFTIDDINELESMWGVKCYRIWSGMGEVGHDPIQGITIIGHAYELECSLPRFWINSGGIWNLIIPMRTSAGLRFNEDDELVFASVIIKGYWTGLFYE
ncbi:MAG: hypothetical protein AAFV33_27230 [Chloroflexota bacterium]